MTDFKESFDGSNACLVSRDGVEPLKFPQIPEGYFAIIVDDMMASFLMNLPRPERDGQEQPRWSCELVLGYGEVVHAKIDDNTDRGVRIAFIDPRTKLNQQRQNEKRRERRA